MIPLKITAHLSTPPAGGPIFMLDGLLLWGIAAIEGAKTPGGWIPEEIANTLPLPLARVEIPDGRWWYACSAAVPPSQKQSVRHVNRRTDTDALLRWTTAKAVDESAGPDKQIRRPRYYWPHWMTMEWTCIGDPDLILPALQMLHGIGQGVPQGQGAIRIENGWTVEPDPNGPTLAQYEWDARIRPLPTDCAAYPNARRVLRTPMPLVPPYWDRARNEDCWKVVER